MKTFKSKFLWVAIVSVVVTMASCKKPKKEEIILPEESDPRIFVLNEGAFLSGNSSISIYNPSTKSMQNDVFGQINNRTLGDVLQSMCLVGDKAYFVMNNSNRIEVAGTSTFASTGVVNDFVMPKYMVAVNDQKAYVTEIVSFSDSSGRVAILDLSTNSVTGRITVGAKPEEMLLLNGKMYVCISGENRISVINTSSNTVESSITVSDGPNSIVKDADGKIWVICGGHMKYDGNWEPDPNTSTVGALVKIDPATGTVESTLPFSEVFGAPAKLNINGSKNTLYYSYDGSIYAHSITASALSSSPLITRKIYGLGVDPTTENIYIGSYGFTSNQHMVRYTSSGSLIDSMEVGVGPNGFLFNY